MKLDLSDLDAAGAEFNVIATRMKSLTVNGFDGKAELEIDDERNATLTFTAPASRSRAKK